MSFRFHDTLTGQLRDFDPVEPGVVRMYNCGPTVYDSPHIGNWRANVCWDVLRRSLELGGFEVRQVMNITDVGHLTLDDLDQGEDKMLVQSRREQLTAWEIAAKYAAEFLEGLDLLNFRKADHYPRATDHIAQMLVMVRRLVESGHAYVSAEGNVYFSVETFAPYGRLSGNTLESLVAGARVEVVADKRHAADFALWKRDPNHQMQWDSPWGRGFPGWHIECSAMSVEYLGEELDVHTGGEDNIFPHHECEIAQSESVSGRTFVRYWLHNRHLLVDGRKMSKSGGTAYTLQDVRDHGFSLRALRYLLLSIHYRLPQNFTWEGLRAAEKAVERLDAMVRGLRTDPTVADSPGVAQMCVRADREFLGALKDDLQTSRALAVVHQFRADVNRGGALSTADRARVRETVGRLDSVLGLRLLEDDRAEDDDGAVQALVDARNTARAAKDWGESDRLRDELLARGIRLEDTAEGVRWYRDG